MMRTADLSDPTSWRAWGGAAYDVPFVSPYTMAPGTEAAHICTVTNLPSCPIGGFAWSTFLGTFVATMDCSLQGGEQFYLATSDDLITWTTPQPLYSAKDLPAMDMCVAAPPPQPLHTPPAAAAAGRRRRQPARPSPPLPPPAAACTCPPSLAAAVARSRKLSPSPPPSRPPNPHASISQSLP